MTHTEMMDRLKAMQGRTVSSTWYSPKDSEALRMAMEILERLDRMLPERKASNESRG